MEPAAEPEIAAGSSLVAGQRYYLEILHKAGAGAGDNWAVGWLQDPAGTNNTPSGVVPGYVLSPYYPPPPSVAPGTLYVADLLPASGVTNMAFGSATLRLSADNSKAVLNFSFSDLSSTVTGEHIDNDPYLSSPSLILFRYFRRLSAAGWQLSLEYRTRRRPLPRPTSSRFSMKARPTSPSSAPIIPTANSSATSSRRSARLRSRRQRRRRPGPTITPTPMPRRAS